MTRSPQPASEALPETLPPVVLRHRDLAAWFEGLTGAPRGARGAARRAALVQAIEVDDIMACRDAALVTRVAELLGRAHHDRGAAGTALRHGLTRYRIAALASAAETQLARLYLDGPETGALEADLALLRACAG